MELRTDADGGASMELEEGVFACLVFGWAIATLTKQLQCGPANAATTLLHVLVSTLARVDADATVLALGAHREFGAARRDEKAGTAGDGAYAARIAAVNRTMAAAIDALDAADTGGAFDRALAAAVADARGGGVRVDPSARAAPRH